MREEGEESDPKFVPITLAWFGLVMKGSEHMGNSSYSDISLRPCVEGPAQVVSN